MENGVLWKKRPRDRAVVITNVISTSFAAGLLAWAEVLHCPVSCPTWVKLVWVAGTWFQRLTAIMIMTGVLVLGAKRVWEGDK